MTELRYDKATGRVIQKVTLRGYIWDWYHDGRVIRTPLDGNKPPEEITSRCYDRQTFHKLLKQLEGRLARGGVINYVEVPKGWKRALLKGKGN